MPKYLVTLADGRTLHVYAPDEAGARNQAYHAETTRIVIATKRDRPAGPHASPPFAVTKVKD